jgi:hypothetical protein
MFSKLIYRKFNSYYNLKRRREGGREREREREREVEEKED